MAIRIFRSFSLLYFRQESVILREKKTVAKPYAGFVEGGGKYGAYRSNRDTEF